MTRAQSLDDGGSRRGAAAAAFAAAQGELLERRQLHAAVQRNDEGGAAGVGDLGAAEKSVSRPAPRRNRAYKLRFYARYGSLHGGVVDTKVGYFGVKLTKVLPEADGHQTC